MADEDDEKVVFLHARGSRKVHIIDPSRSKMAGPVSRYVAFCSDDWRLNPFPANRRAYYLCAQCVELATAGVARESEVDWAEASALVGEMEPW